MKPVIVALNSGSSSVKFQVLDAEADTAPMLSGLADRIGSGQAHLSCRTDDGRRIARDLPLPDHATALRACAGALDEMMTGLNVVAVSHRVVHGGAVFAEPVTISPETLQALEALTPLAPLHLPACLSGIEAARALFPDAVQVGCFDTGFHAGKPLLNDAFALPLRFYDDGLRRYGFHGLSCQSILRHLSETGDTAVPTTFLISHLGNGCSVTAVRDGKSVSNSMAFSTLDGLPMGTRCGRLDPGAMLYLLRQGLSADELEQLLYRESGLLGLSGVSNDLRDLLASDNPRAAAAVDYFVAACQQEIARAATVLGGAEAVIFCGGIGENATGVRQRIIDGLSILRTPGGAPMDFRVVATDEERELAIAARRFLPAVAG
ncbi:acetate/propionate family kinase [Antarctobacter jejuensis]|uniref:acetate/propionate family kinase n=1 Tax=Antarctobacter jejuensis TaxID=1439938 RepID=UPI003FCF3F7A